MDAVYSAMIRAIETGKTPNLFVLHYEPDAWSVRNLILIPSFAFSRSAIEKRPPLGPNARRAGWVGCNILLENIPDDARIPIITDGVSSEARSVRRQYSRLKPLAKLDVEKRGWTLDVLNVVHSLGKREFGLADVYSKEKHLARLHVGNRHVRDKIRQQLQVLRDIGLIEFLGAGHYRLR
jgi:type II restriction enzyme